MYPRILDLREEKNLSQTQLAKVLAIPQRTYAHYERGDRDPSVAFLCLLADFYDVSLDYIVGRTDKRK